ncbi:agenet domain-containing protein [Tanacetum coccineum]
MPYNQASEDNEENHELIFDHDDIHEIEETELPPLICKMGKSSRNKKRVLESFQIYYPNEGPSGTKGELMTREEADREKLAINICERYAILEEIRPVIETLAYSNKYRKLLDEICLDKKKLDKEIKDEQKEAIKRVKGEALIEKEDPGAFIFPIRLEGKINLNGLADTGSKVNVMPYRIYMDLGRKKVKKVNKGIEMINHSLAEPMGLLKDVLYQIGVTTIIAKFLILDIPIDIDAQIMVGRGFLSTCGGVLDTIDRVMSTYDGAALKPFHQICVWKKAVSFLVSLPLPLQHVDWKPEYNGYHKNKEKGTGKWKAEIRLTDPYGNIYNQGFTTKKTSRKWLNTTS